MWLYFGSTGKEALVWMLTTGSYKNEQLTIVNDKSEHSRKWHHIWELNISWDILQQAMNLVLKLLFIYYYYDNLLCNMH